MAKVAIVEDDKAIAEMYRIKFETDGNKVFTAEDGKAGLELVEKNKPDILLLDLMMPVMTGDEMLKALRKTDWGKDLKVIILTNVSKDDAEAKLKGLKVDGYIVKAHYTPQEVVDMVKTALAGGNN
ncbi:MAG: response regulator transcription factor [Candidatus Saccharimonadales bacterium]